MISALKAQNIRLGEFLQALQNDPFTARNQFEAHAFLKKHLDAVELAALPPEKCLDFTVRMNIPAFTVQVAWSCVAGVHEWKAFGHVVRISDNGSIDIKTKSGQQWFFRAGAV